MPAESRSAQVEERFFAPQRLHLLTHLGELALEIVYLDLRYLVATSSVALRASAVWRRAPEDGRGQIQHKYWPSECPRCPIKNRCTPSYNRIISRWEHEDVLERMQERLNHAPQASRWRRQVVEHVFATIKSWAGSAHLLTKTLPRVRTEIRLHVLAYNMKRAMQILGVQPLMQAMRA